ncbi:MAG TPA: hypothetical protein VG498_08485 [Terriglobales bacterium]|nr:hypothetical protein [Terriglobales bacterium]
MLKIARLCAILCVLCTRAPLTIQAIAANNSADRDNGSTGAKAQIVRPLFGFDATSSGPFPSDHFTVFDLNQNTGLRVSIPPRPSAEECRAKLSLGVADTDTGEICLLNELDGFSIRPRISIPFSGPIDPGTARGNIYLIPLGDTLVDGHPPDYEAMVEADDDNIQLPPDIGVPIGINQVVWDHDSNTLYAQTASFLDQHTRYALIVTRGVHDENGNPIEQADGFNRLRGRNDNSSDPEVKAYSQALKVALAVLELKGVHRKDIAVASVFSTLSSTAVMEKVRSHVMSLPQPRSAQFDIGPNGSLAVFDLSSMTDLIFNRQLQTDTTKPLSPMLPSRFGLLRLLDQPNQPMIAKIAYGKYSSPNYLDHNALMSPVATFSGTPVLQPICGTCTETYHDVYFNVFIPAGTPPALGWPVVLYGNGSADNMNGGPFNVAADFASHGFATVGFNLVGQGYGPLSSITVSKTGGSSVTIALPGRTLYVNANGTYTSDESSDLVGPKTLLFGREANRQNVADIVQLIRLLEEGINVGGAHLDASHIYFTGLSAGANLGVELAAVEPRIRATGVASAGGWPSPWLLPANRGLVGTFLANRTPPLLNADAPPIITFGGVSVGKPYFNENMPAPGHDIVNDCSSTSESNCVPGASEIQSLFDRIQWLTSAGSPGSFAPYVRRKPLAGVPPRPFFILMAKGDESLSNLQTLEGATAGDFADRIVRYLHDVFWQHLTPAQQTDPKNALLKNPHGTINRTDFTTFSAIAPPDCCTWRDVALMAQDQVAYFFLHDYLSMTDSQDIIDPPRDKYHLFEVPAQSIFECGTATLLSNCDFSYIP